jgi:ribosomal 30S subunit maturation factor RimM
MKKMQLWGSKIDFKYFDTIDQEKLTEFTNSCETLMMEIKKMDDGNADEALNNCEVLMKEIDFDSLERNRF